MLRRYCKANKIAYLLSLCLIFFFPLAQAEPYKLLIINSQTGDPYEPARDAMLAELAVQGYIPEKNLEVKQFYIHNKIGLALRILGVEAERNYDAIVINGTIANQAAYQFGYDNPRYKFVFCSITDPVGEGLIERFNSPPKANFTGIAYGLPADMRLRLMMEALPSAQTIGLIYADMPQSHSYIGWLKEALQQPEFSHLKIIYRKVPFVYGDKGHLRMAQLLKNHVQELDPLVDVFLTPSDQLGTKKEFAQVISSQSNKPLMAISEKEIKNGWGADFGLFAQQHRSGKVAGEMVVRLFKGEPIRNIKPVYPEGVVGINLFHARQKGVSFPDSVIRKAGNNLYDSDLHSGPQKGQMIPGHTSASRSH